MMFLLNEFDKETGQMIFRSKNYKIMRASKRSIKSRIKASNDFKEFEKDFLCSLVNMIKIMPKEKEK